MWMYTAEDIRRAAPMRKVIEAVRRAFIQVSEGDAVQPPRVQIPVPAVDGTTLIMPGYLPSDGQMAVKIVSVFPGNLRHGIPVINALVCAVDTGTGQPQAILNGTALTALRTGAASGVATDLLAPATVRSAAIFGAGIQGRTQLEAIATVRTLEEAWVYDTDRSRAAAFAEEMGAALGLPVRVADSADAAAASADVIATVTTSATPVFSDGSIRPGTHINAIGVFKPHMQEIPSATVARSRVFVDSVEAAMEEAGDLLIPIKAGLITADHILAEIGRVASGRTRGRTAPDQVTLFKSVGVAAQDVVTAALVMENASKLGIGTEVSL